MTDIVVTVPRAHWPDFIASHRPLFPCARRFCADHPPLAVADWIFFAAHRRIRCAMEVTQVVRRGPCLIAAGTFRPALTIAETVPGFPGWRRAWFSMREVKDFSDWRTKGIWYPGGQSPPPVDPAAPPAALPAYAHGKSRAEQGGCS